MLVSYQLKLTLKSTKGGWFFPFVEWFRDTIDKVAYKFNCFSTLSDNLVALTAGDNTYKYHSPGALTQVGRCYKQKDAPQSYSYNNYSPYNVLSCSFQ
jgi:hypothetical protein